MNSKGFLPDRESWLRLFMVSLIFLTVTYFLYPSNTYSSFHLGDVAILGAAYLTILVFQRVILSALLRFLFVILFIAALSTVGLALFSVFRLYLIFEYQSEQVSSLKELPELIFDFSLSGNDGTGFTSMIVLGVCLLAPWVFLAFWSWIEERREQKEASRTGFFHQRGRKLVSFEEAEDKATVLRSQATEFIDWGWLTLPEEVSSGHFLVVGATGSGKTISLRLLMQSVLPRIGQRDDYRAIIYDAKQDVLSTLAGIGVEHNVTILNPFDQRGASWDMARDINSPATAHQVASILIPENKSASQPFFSDAARHLLTGVLISFIKRVPGEWSFRDVILALRTRKRLIQVLSACRETADLVDQYFGDDRTAQNVMSTIATKLQRFEFIAASWDSALESISLEEWLVSDSILVLGNDEAHRSALDAVNQLVFKRISELILAKEESDTPRTWIFLDEVREAGRLDGLSSLLTKGRSKGATVVLGFQDIEGMREVYGTKTANELVGQCANKALLRCDSPETARWCSELFGTEEVNERKKAISRKYETETVSSTNLTESRTERKAVLPSELLEMPQTSRQNGMKGFYLLPNIGAYSFTASGELISHRLVERDSAYSDFEPREDSSQYLRPWDDIDLMRLELADDKDIENLESSPRDKSSPLFQIVRKDFD